MKSKTKRGLGRGLEALLPPVVQEVKPGEMIENIEIGKIVPNPYQPRLTFNPEKLAELADSIKQFGILQPVVLRKVGKGYELVSGERRCRAAHKAGLKVVPAVVRSYDDLEMSEIALVENLQRDDLNPMEEAAAYKKLAETFDYTQEKLADRLGKSRPAVANTMRLLQLAPSVQRFLADRKLTPGQVRPLPALQDPKAQVALAVRIVEEGLSARQVEDLMKKRPKIGTTAKPAADVHVTEYQERIASILGTKVTLKPSKAGKGTLEIEYYSLDDLERLVEIFGSEKKKTTGPRKPFVL